MVSTTVEVDTHAGAKPLNPQDGGNRTLTGFAATVWIRSRRFFAEARVFQRRPAGPIEVIRLETDEEDAALALLEGKIEETYGSVKFVRWWKMGDDAPSGY